MPLDRDISVYDWGPVCKHTAAALLAIQAEPPKEETQEGDARKISIRDLVERAEKEQLAELILEHCRKDKRFESLSQQIHSRQQDKQRDFQRLVTLPALDPSVGLDQSVLQVPADCVTAVPIDVATLSIGADRGPG